MKNFSNKSVLTIAVVLTIFSYVQGVVVPNTALKYQQAAVAKSQGVSEKADLHSGPILSSSYYKKPCKVTPFSKCGTIIIRKSASPAQYTDFSFTSNVLGSQNFFLDDDGSLPNPSSLPNQKIISVTNGTYYINESPVISGFDVYVACSDPVGGDTYTNATGAVVTISNHETVNCSFRNIGSPKPCEPSHTKCGKIAIIKDAVPDNSQDFTFTTNILGYPNNITLDDDATLPNPSPTPNIQTFSVPQTGNYSITENPVDSWNVAISCIDPSGGTTIGGNTANISMSNAEAIVCTFTNTLATVSACTPNTWTQKADFGGDPRLEAVGFSIGDKGYVGTGISSPSGTIVEYKDFWQYNPVTDTWTQKTDFPIVIDSATGFSIGNKGYVDTGGPYSNSNFYEYDPITDIWTQKANLPYVWPPPVTNSQVVVDAAGFSIDNKGYVGTGLVHDPQNSPWTNQFFGTNSFWEYNSIVNTWTQKANLPGAERGHAIAFSIGNKGYIGTGTNPDFIYPHYQGYQDFYEYNPATNTWTQKADFGGANRGYAVGFSIGNKGYVGTGWSPDIAVYQDFWQYDPATNTWTQKADFPGGPRMGAVGFSIGNKGYVGTGNSSNGYIFDDVYQDFWEYCP